MNATAQDASVAYKKMGVRTRINRSMQDFVDGFASVKALADAISDSTKLARGEGAAKITGTDMKRASGNFGEPISEAKMTAIIKFLRAKVDGFSEEKDVVKSDTFKFVEGLNYVVAARKNASRASFAKVIDATESEIEDAEKGRSVREALFDSYRTAIESNGLFLKKA